MEPDQSEASPSSAPPALEAVTEPDRPVAPVVETPASQPEAEPVAVMRPLSDTNSLPDLDAEVDPVSAASQPDPDIPSAEVVLPSPSPAAEPGPQAGEVAENSTVSE